MSTGTVSMPFATGYSASKTALIRITATIQAELNSDGLGDAIQLYSLHPGAVLTGLSLRMSPYHASN